MTEQLTQEQLDTETDAMIIHMERDQRKGWLKFGAILTLVFIAAFFVLYTSMLIPAMVISMMGQ